MSDLYRQLVQDHITLTKVLNALDRSISCYAEDEEREPNLPLVLDTLEYIQVYPEKFHHPLEEHAFNYLLNHHLGDKTIIQEIQIQHKHLETETARLCQQFNAIANDHVISMDALHRDISHYINAQRHHLTTENENIFPTLAKLNEQAWWDIASGLIIHGDPLFSDDPERQSFAALATAVIQEQHDSEYNA
jgi:hemerythrin-like domain-containing protein